MRMAIQNGVEIEIIVRSRKDGKPSGKSSCLFVEEAGMKIGEAGRKQIATAVQERAQDYLTSLVVGPAK